VGQQIACDLTLLGSDAVAVVQWGIDTGRGQSASIDRTDECHVKEKKTCTLGGAIGAVVIGEYQKRVIATADAMAASYYHAPDGPPYLWMRNSELWINQVMDQRCRIFDIGASPGRDNFPWPTSGYYVMELQQIRLRDYPTIPILPVGGAPMEPFAP
jgi:hypothetical protein